MSENSEKPKGRVTPSQWLTVGVLAMIFVVVLIVQFGSAGASSQPIDATIAPVPNSRRPPTVSHAADSQGASGRRPPPKLDRAWPGFTLSTVLEYDPFAQTASLASIQAGIQQGSKPGDSAARQSEDAEKKRSEREQALAQVRREVVRTVVGTDKGFVAVVGTKTIRVGDRLHGFRVKEITRDGVVLEDGNN
jgi:hypothetical protein